MRTPYQLDGSSFREVASLDSGSRPRLRSRSTIGDATARGIVVRVFTEPVAEIAGTTFRGTPRFEVRRRLGMGGSGIVYEAYDRELGETIALKTLRRTSPADVQQLKREFRTLADVRHPNLVSLRELHHVDATWFFTMELVRGVSFLDWIWDVPDRERPTEVRLDRERLTAALSQLVEALRALHAAGHLHRDVKPSNVMVAEGGRVVVLDFGLATMIGTRAGLPMGGSPGYAAPEVADARQVGPASDWYSVGAMLHEAVRGHVPRPPDTVVIGGRDPVVLNAGEFQDLAEIAEALVEPDPARRRIDVLALEHSSAEPSREVGMALVGREHELARLDAALAASASAPTIAVVHGPSGIGKTRLLEVFLESAASRAITLSATCRDREMIPFRAFDGVVEAFVQHLKAQDPVVSEVSAIQAYALIRTFPPFLAIGAIARRASSIREVPEPQALRRVAFAAFATLIAGAGQRVPVVIAIDDVQWGDSDSADLLRELLFANVPAGLLVVLGCRSDGELPGTLPSWWQAALEHTQTVSIAVGSLTTEQMAALVELVGGPPASASVQRIVAESGGNPFFAMQLVQHSTQAPGDQLPALDDVLTQQLNALSRGARALVEDLALVGRPLEHDVALVLGARASGARASLAELQRMRLAIVRSIGTTSVVEIAHDRLRSAISNAVAAERWSAQHRRLGELLESIPRLALEADLLFALFYEAGLRDKASLYAERAAARAANAFAFHQAAELYRKAEECTNDEARRRALRRKLADALADAGRGAFAAPMYDELASTAPRNEALALRQRAMEGYLTSGHLDQGLGALRAICEELDLGFPATPGRAFASSLWLIALARLRGITIGASAPALREEAVRIDACFSAAKGLIGSDAIRGAYFAFRALDLASRARDPERTTRYLAFVGAAILASAGGALERWGKRMLAMAEQEIERRGEPELVGTLLVCKGQVAILDGRWREALTLSDRALEILVERCRNVGWEKNFAHMGTLRALEELGHQRESMVRVERFLREAAQAGDVYARVTAQIWRGLNRLALGNVDGARADADAAVRAWSPQGYHVQHLYAMRVHLHADLYEGKPYAAMARLDRDRRAIDASFLTRVPTGRIDVALMRGRTALALARLDQRRRPELLATVDRIAKALGKEARLDAVAHASLLEAGTCALRGDRSRAIARYATARAGFASLSMELLEACAKHRESELVGGSRGEQLRAEALATMANQDIREPHAWLKLWAPGFAEN